MPFRDTSIQWSVAGVCFLFLRNSIPLWLHHSCWVRVCSDVLIWQYRKLSSPCHRPPTPPHPLISLTLEDSCLESPGWRRPWVKSDLPVSPSNTSFWSCVCMYVERYTSCQLMPAADRLRACSLAPLSKEHMVCCIPLNVAGWSAEHSRLVQMWFRFQTVSFYFSETQAHLHYSK